MKAVKFILIIIVFTITHIQLLSSDVNSDGIFGYFGMFPSFEFTYIDNSNINKVLNSAELPTTNNLLVNFGFAYQMYFNQIIPTIAYNTSTTISNHSTLHTEYTSFSINLGYDLLHTHRYWLYPYIGYKNCKINYQYNQKFEGETMEDFLSANLISKELTNSRSHIDIGIGASIQKLVMLNLRAGYLIPIEKVYWKTNNSLYEFKEAPKLNYKFYFIIAIGLGETTKDTWH